MIKLHVRITKDHLLTQALCNVRRVSTVNRITQTRYNWMNLIGKVIFYVCDNYRIKEKAMGKTRIQSAGIMACMTQ